MSKIFVKDLKSGMEFIDFFMVKSIDIRVGSNHKQYLDIHLADKTGEVNGKKWDVGPDEEPQLSAIKPGQLVKVKAQVSEWQGMTQLRILRIRKSQDRDSLLMSDFIKTAPEDSQAMFDFLLHKAEEIKDKDFRCVAVKLLKDNRERLLYYPAAAKNHHAEYGGLLWHMKRMLMTGDAIASIYTFLNRDLIRTGVIIHDMEKLNEIDADRNGMASGYSKKGQLLGHIIQGIVAVDSFAKENAVPAEKALLLEHMILSHHYEPEFGSPKKPMFPEAEILHYIDMIDARMYDMEEAVKGTASGSFSERVRTLDMRRLYVPDLDQEEKPEASESEKTDDAWRKKESGR